MAGRKFIAVLVDGSKCDGVMYPKPATLETDNLEQAAGWCRDGCRGQGAYTVGYVVDLDSTRPMVPVYGTGSSDVLRAVSKGEMEAPMVRQVLEEKGTETPVTLTFDQEPGVSMYPVARTAACAGNDAGAAYLAAQYDNLKSGVNPHKQTPPPGVPVAWAALYSKEEVADIPFAQAMPTEPDQIMMDIPEAWKLGTAEGVTVAVLDTGTRKNSRYLKGVVVGSIDCTGQSPTGHDGNGHGTFVASQIGGTYEGKPDIGTATGVKIVSIKVLTDAGWGTDAMIARGIRAAIQAGVPVLNMSLGGPGEMPLTAAAIADAHRQGVIVVAATGNDGREAGFPARIPGVVQVGSVGPQGRKSTFGNVGTAAYLSACGERQVGCGPSDGLEYWNGTSMAAPHVSAACALAKGICLARKVEWPELKAAVGALLVTAKQPDPNHLETDIGAGVVQFGGLAKKLAGDGPDPQPDAVVIEVPPSGTLGRTLDLIGDVIGYLADGIKVTLVPPATGAGKFTVAAERPTSTALEIIKSIERMTSPSVN